MKERKGMEGGKREWRKEREKRKGRAKAGFPSASGKLEGEAVAKGDFVLWVLRYQKGSQVKL